MKLRCGSQDSGEFSFGTDSDEVADFCSGVLKELIGEEEDRGNILSKWRKRGARSYVSEFQDSLFGVEVSDVECEEARYVRSNGDVGETDAEVRIAGGTVHDECEQLGGRLGLRNGDYSLTEQNVSGHVVDGVACGVHGSSEDAWSGRT
jgi:hypothetical protein